MLQQPPVTAEGHANFRPKQSGPSAISGDPGTRHRMSHLQRYARASVGGGFYESPPPPVLPVNARWTHFSWSRQ